MKKTKIALIEGSSSPAQLKNVEGDAAYSTFQKDSEPGNRQGDDAPNLNTQFYSPQSLGGGESDGQISQQVQMIQMKSPPKTSRNSMALDGSSFDEEYNRYENSEMQDIQSEGSKEKNKP